ncbi:MAG: hypothetical protein RR748_04205, partial [Pseudomonas sp.]
GSRGIDRVPFLASAMPKNLEGARLRMVWGWVNGGLVWGCREGKKSKAPQPGPLSEGQGTDRGIWKNDADLERPSRIPILKGPKIGALSHSID